MALNSINIIQKRTTGSYTDNFLRTGQCVMTRKFDPALIPTGSWNELWLGFRWRLNLAHHWSGSISSSIMMTNGAASGADPSPPFNEKCPFSIGICKVGSGVYGSTSMVNTSSISHSLGISSVLGGSAYGGMNLTGSLIQYGSTVRLASVNTGSIVYSTSTTNEYFNLPCTPNPDLRHFWAIRFITGSAVGSWTANLAFPSVNSLADDIIIQSKVADLFTASNWTAFSKSLGSQYAQFILFPDIQSSQASCGYFDGIYVTWVPFYDYLEISDVIVRKI